MYLLQEGRKVVWMQHVVTLTKSKNMIGE
jgi:hypothetical protein